MVSRPKNTPQYDIYFNKVNNCIVYFKNLFRIPLKCILDPQNAVRLALIETITLESLVETLLLPLLPQLPLSC